MHVNWQPRYKNTLAFSIKLGLMAFFIKLEALQKSRAEKIAHTLEQYMQQDAHENDDDDDDAVDRELEEVQ
jgi:hypothetical protein